MKNACRRITNKVEAVDGRISMLSQLYSFIYTNSFFVSVLQHDQDVEKLKVKIVQKMIYMKRKN